MIYSNASFRHTIYSNRSKWKGVLAIDVEHIGNTIKAARKANRISQRTLARKSGIPQSHISKIENKGVDLKLTSLLALTRALDLEPMLVPRKLIPAVESLIRTSKRARVTTHLTVRSAYTLDEEEADDNG